MKKGILFAGCSFTWGQGLYYYSGLETLKEPAPEQFDKKLIKDAHLRFMWTIRFPRLVANHFETFEIVKKETQNAPTLFMGDGINDAPALMLASVGIAFGQGNNITSESSGAVILESNLLKVDELIHISIFTRKIILQENHLVFCCPFYL